MEIVDQAVSDDGEQPQSTPERRLNMRVALAVAVLATFMGVTKVKDDNIVQAMLQAKSDAVDTWSEFQAKSTKQHLAQVTEDQFAVQRALAGARDPAAARLLDARVSFYHAEQKRYDQEKTELEKKAKALETSYDSLNAHDDQFDLSDAVLSIALALLAVTALTRQRWLFILAMVPAAFGVIMGIAGLLGWGLHPTALTRLLS
jgi:Domain of unknown function (DUF4337)